MITLRDEYQTPLFNAIFEAWGKPRSDGVATPSNVIAVLPTGGGKTAVMSATVKAIDGPTVSIAHRQELVSQISMALARNEIPHRVLASPGVVRFCISEHIRHLGRTFHHDNAPNVVTGVATLLNRADSMGQFLNQVKAWNVDEAHHMAGKNVWVKATSTTPNAFGVGWTATPTRADRKPLGRVNGGLFDHMVQGPTMRDLMNMGYLTDYRLILPETSIDRVNIPISESTGDLNSSKMREASHESEIVGDMVANYLKFSAGEQAVGFVVDIETAKDVAQRFNDAGVPAMAVSSKTDANVRRDAVDRFRRGDLKVLMNVDLFGEGFDVPAIVTVMMGRPTESLVLYMQYFGRALRPCEGKTHGIIIDHVGNCERHGLPDAPRVWSLEQDIRGTPRGQRDPDVMPIRRCTSCFRGYEAISKICPFCGHIEQPSSRSGPAFVDGDLTEVSPEVLARMRGEVTEISGGDAVIPVGVTDPAIIGAIKKNFRIRQAAQSDLHDCINLWAGVEIYTRDLTETQAHRKFYHTFGVDVLSAQSMSRRDMVKLTDLIRGKLS